VALGFPDILLKPKNAFKKLISKLKEEKDTSVVLGLFPTNRPEKYDMVLFDKNHTIKDIVIKQPKQVNLDFAWIIAAWKPRFTAFLDTFVKNKLQNESKNELSNNEYYLGDVIRDAIKSGIIISGVLFNNGEFLDIGTPEDLNRVNYFLSV
jgi:glucose-1-phosphate thymidylyltransferase